MTTKNNERNALSPEWWRAWMV